MILLPEPIDAMRRNQLHHSGLDILYKRSYLSRAVLQFSTLRADRFYAGMCLNRSTVALFGTDITANLVPTMNMRTAWVRNANFDAHLWCRIKRGHDGKRGRAEAMRKRGRE